MALSRNLHRLKIVCVTFTVQGSTLFWRGQEDQLEPTYSSFVLIQDVAQKTCRKQWMGEMGGWERVRDIRADGATWHDDDLFIILYNF